MYWDNYCITIWKKHLVGGACYSGGVKLHHSCTLGGYLAGTTCNDGIKPDCQRLLLLLTNNLHDLHNKQQHATHQLLCSYQCLYRYFDSVGDRGNQQHALQHWDCCHDGICERCVQVGATTKGSAGAVCAAACALCPTFGRGNVAGITVFSS